MEATLEAQNAPERQKWLACWVVLLVSWLRRSTSVLWRLRAPRFWTIAITSLSTAARRVGRGCQEAILANCPAHQRIDRDVVDTFLRSLGSLLIITSTCTIAYHRTDGYRYNCSQTVVALIDDGIPRSQHPHFLHKSTRT